MEHLEKNMMIKARELSRGWEKGRQGQENKSQMIKRCVVRYPIKISSKASIAGRYWSISGLGERYYWAKHRMTYVEEEVEVWIA